MFKENPFPLPKHIDSFFFPHEQTSLLCLYKTHIDVSLLCVYEHKCKHKHQFYVHICIYVCVCVHVYETPVYISKITCHQKEMAEHLQNSTSLICSANRGDTQSQRRKEEPHERRKFTICFAGPPLTGNCLLFGPFAFSRAMVRRGVGPCPCVTKGHKPGVAAISQENLSGEGTVMTNQQPQPEPLFLLVSPPWWSQMGSHQHFTSLCRDGSATGFRHLQTGEGK